MNKTFDSALQLKDSYALTASAAAQVASAAKVINVGAGRINAKAIHMVSAANVSAAANLYTIEIQGSTDEAFTAKVTLSSTKVGHKTALGEAADKGVGTYEQAFCNEVAGVIYPYIREYVAIAGSPVSITHISYIAKAE